MKNSRSFSAKFQGRSHKVKTVLSVLVPVFLYPAFHTEDHLLLFDRLFPLESCTQDCLGFLLPHESLFLSPQYPVFSDLLMINIWCSILGPLSSLSSHAFLGIKYYIYSVTSKFISLAKTSHPKSILI